jgi:hypothetical protein
MDGEKAKAAMTPNAAAAVTSINNLAIGSILLQRRNRGGDQTIETALPPSYYRPSKKEYSLLPADWTFAASSAKSLQVPQFHAPWRSDGSLHVFWRE